MELKWVAPDDLPPQELLALMEMECAMSGARLSVLQLRHQMRRGMLLVVYESDIPAGFAVLDPECTYLSGCTLIEKLCYCWEYNRPDWIAEMLTGILEYVHTDYISMAVDGRHELNMELYRALGFTASAMRSPVNSSHRLIVARCTEIKKHGAGDTLRKN